MQSSLNGNEIFWTVFGVIFAVLAVIGGVWALGLVIRRPQWVRRNGDAFGGLCACVAGATFIGFLAIIPPQITRNDRVALYHHEQQIAAEFKRHYSKEVRKVVRFTENPSLDDKVDAKFGDGRDDRVVYYETYSGNTCRANIQHDDLSGWVLFDGGDVHCKATALTGADPKKKAPG